MNDGINLLMTRRSVRTYTDAPVSDDDVETILRAAMAAPSAGNQQSWHFVVIRDRATMDQIRDIHPYSAMLDHAPVCIAVLGDESLERFAGYWVQDCSAATMNILMAAHALGLGAVWLGVHPIPERQEGMRRILGLPEGVNCLSLISIGHPAGPSEPADRYNPDRVRQEKW